MVNIEKMEYTKSRGTPALMPVLAMALGRANMTCPICNTHATHQLALQFAYKLQSLNDNQRQACGLQAAMIPKSMPAEGWAGMAGICNICIQSCLDRPPGWRSFKEARVKHYSTSTWYTWAAADVSHASNQLPAPDFQPFITPLLLESAALTAQEKPLDLLVMTNSCCNCLLFQALTDFVIY